MQLTHEFTVPASVDATWLAFNDIADVAGCFPGAVVTSVEGDTFQGSCKVKLGPIALVYNGSGTFLEKDESVHSMKIAAKGKDKRGNGTAGADVVATMTPTGESETHVRVVTDLNITGKPAQFGRGVMQDVSDKLLVQFVGCLVEKVGSGEPAAEGTGAPVAEPAPAAAGLVAPPPPPPVAAAPARPGVGPPPGEGGARAAEPEALDLGAAVIPILLKSYGKQIAVALGVVLVLGWLIRRRRHLS